MKALTWHGKRDVRVDNVPDPTIQEPTDAIIRITTTAICGSDLHLYEVLDPFLNAGDILGHEPIGIVEEVGPEVTNLQPGDRMVIPFQISCGHCFTCEEGLQTQCETTQVRDQGMGAALFGYTELYGEVPGAQAEYLRVPQAQYTHIKVPEGPPLLGLSSTQLLFPIIPLAHDVLLEGKASLALVRTRPHGRWRSTLPAAAPRLLIA
jgi:threonine dehydrogenase-like Zn-dependent dehydrogenase